MILRTIRLTITRGVVALIAFLRSLYEDFKAQSPLKQVGLVIGVVTGTAGVVGWAISHATWTSAPETPPHAESIAPADVGMTLPLSLSPVAKQPLKDASKEKEARLSAARKLNRQMEDFSAILSRGDAILKTWLGDTQSDPAAEAAKLTAFSADVYKMRLALEADYNTMQGDQALVGDLVKEAKRPPGAEGGPNASIFFQTTQAADILANDIASLKQYDRQNLEDRLTATVDVLQKCVSGLRVRQRQWSILTQAEIKSSSPQLSEPTFSDVVKGFFRE
jgi:hypothetical protein